jgi:hypothetical protein
MFYFLNCMFDVLLPQITFRGEQAGFCRYSRQEAVFRLLRFGQSNDNLQRAYKNAI